VSKKQNPVILNEAQHSEESFKKQNISTSRLHDFTTHNFTIFQYSSEPSKTPSFHHISENFVIENIQFPQSFIANEFRQLCFLKNIGIIKNLCVKKIAKDAIKKRLTKNQQAFCCEKPK